MSSPLLRSGESGGCFTQMSGIQVKRQRRMGLDDNDEIPACRQPMACRTEGLSQQALDAVALRCVADTSADGQPKSAAFLIPLHAVYDQWA